MKWLILAGLMFAALWLCFNAKAEEPAKDPGYLVVMAFDERNGPNHMYLITVKCPDWECVAIYDNAARNNAYLQTFYVYPGGAKLLAIGHQAIFDWPIYTWSPA